MCCAIPTPPTSPRRLRARKLERVMSGLDPGIWFQLARDCRVKPGNDDVSLTPQHRSDGRRPLRRLEAVVPEQRQRNPLHPESDAGTVRRLAISGPDPPEHAEIVLRVIEAQARGRLLGAGDRD